MAARKKEVELKKYIVKCSDGDFIIEVPSTYKLTFSAVNPTSPQNYRDGFCLRVWEGEKLRAVFNNVLRFRDMAIPYAKKVSKETGAASWERDSQGNFSRSEEVTVEHQLEEGDPF